MCNNKIINLKLFKMKYLIILFMAVMAVGFTSSATKYMTKNGKISFYSDAPLEKIEAKNSQVNAALDVQTGDILFKVLIKSFVFEKALMQKHFNENYMESDKFPTSTYKGKITNLTEVKFDKAGTYNSKVNGQLNIHGVTKDVAAQGTITVNADGINIKAKFKINIGDYGIKIPGAVTGKIAEEVEIIIDADMKPLSN
jgi:polyisoprenoid-binding protein YceI